METGNQILKKSLSEQIDRAPAWIFDASEAIARMGATDLIDRLRPVLHDLDEIAARAVEALGLPGGVIPNTGEGRSFAIGVAGGLLTRDPSQPTSPEGA